jgi:hypothetical protein
VDGRLKVQKIDELLGKSPLPWEKDRLAPERKRKLGVFKNPILQLLSRDPLQRMTLPQFCNVCRNILSPQTTSTAPPAPNGSSRLRSEPPTATLSTILSSPAASTPADTAASDVQTATATEPATSLHQEESTS